MLLNPTLVQIQNILNYTYQSSQFETIDQYLNAAMYLVELIGDEVITDAARTQFTKYLLSRCTAEVLSEIAAGGLFAATINSPIVMGDHKVSDVISGLGINVDDFAGKTPVEQMQIISEKLKSNSARKSDSVGLVAAGVCSTIQDHSDDLSPTLQSVLDDVDPIKSAINTMIVDYASRNPIKTMADVMAATDYAHSISNTQEQFESACHDVLMNTEFRLDDNE